MSITNRMWLKWLHERQDNFAMIVRYVLNNERQRSGEKITIKLTVSGVLC
jgi:hypothetical protein